MTFRNGGWHRVPAPRWPRTKRERRFSRIFSLHFPGKSDILVAFYEKDHNREWGVGMRIAIVDDEDSSAQKLQEYLLRFAKESGHTIDVQCFPDGMSFVNAFKSQFDVILLDVSMPGIDGMETAKRIRRSDPDVVILFVTNMAQYAIRGYEVDALDYVLKPVTYFSFSQRLNRAISRVKRHDKHYLIVPTKNGAKKMDVASICYVESQGHTLIYHTTAGDFVTSGTMKEIEEKLLPFHFFRCNKGYLVSLEHVDGIENGCAMVNGQALLISRARKNEFMDALANCLGGALL